jgi:hypothetical protein
VRVFLLGQCLVEQINRVWTSPSTVATLLRRHPPPSPPYSWHMSALSTHLISAYTGLINTSALPPFASVSQTVRTPPILVISGPMSYKVAMVPPFFYSQQLQPRVSTDNGQRNADLSAQTAQQISTLQARLDKKLGPEYNEQTQRYCVGSQQSSRSLCVIGRHEDVEFGMLGNCRQKASTR